jgi:Na+/phosphate symporter
MKDQRFVVNPFRMISPKLDTAASKTQELHELPVSDSHATEEGLLIMMSKLIEMSKILSKCIITADGEQMAACERLAEEVHDQERLLTSSLLAASSTLTSTTLGQNIFKIVVRFPARLERIGDIFQNILTCCRIKASDGIPFSDKAHAELAQIFPLLGEMLTNTRDALVIRNKALLQHIGSERKNLSELLHTARFAHWDRLERGFCAPQASSLYLDLLDSFGAISEYIGKMCDSLSAIREEETQESK